MQKELFLLISFIILISVGIYIFQQPSKLQDTDREETTTPPPFPSKTVSSYDCPPALSSSECEFKQLADEKLADYFGDYFLKYVSFQKAENDDLAGRKSVVFSYIFRLNSTNFIQPLSVVVMPADGRPEVFVKDDLEANMPNCSENPGECEFLISRKRAVELAKVYGLEEGFYPPPDIHSLLRFYPANFTQIGNYTTYFNWHYRNRTFVWGIAATRRLASCADVPEFVRVMMIDANSGDLIDNTSIEIFDICY